MATPSVPKGVSPIYEAAPDVEVNLIVKRQGEIVTELEANINISRTTFELKQSLSKALEVEVQFMELWKDSIRLEDNEKLLTYEINTDDTLVIEDKSPSEKKDKQ